ncbi:hypothetical protein [Candidatus Symbiothrix dinenymphae]|uniref:hypothetical protein n=1 Tax=Candidatus Symbiothrix dinenymphae TaxID=467085 RepID=UPI0006C0CAA5|nr:hypothetical protein [Candidatus Symbiothrix dinenymphae]GAP73005.1 hypothetical protein SAMD00024442_54_7 [Candidatus Symbiothrix dinenymphae]
MKAKAKLFCVSLLLATIGCSAKETYRVSSGKSSIELTKSGEIVGFKTGKVSRPIRGCIRLAGCSDEEGITVRKQAKGILEFSRIVKNQSGNQARITERFIPNHTGIRWEAEIAGLDAPWTTPIQRVWDYNYPNSVTENVKFWTAWSDPACSDTPGTGKWTDPLSPQDISQLSDSVKLYYGLVPFNFNSTSSNTPITANLFCIPMLSFLEPDSDFGITLAQALSDTLLDITLSLTKTGEATLEYLNHRISKNSPIILRADIVPHEADWRGGLRYVTETYPEYFEPVIPIAHEIAGTASYSNAMDKICANAEKYHKMSYRINWQASYDFPWFGMYIPPVADDVEWTTFGHSSGGTRPYTIKKYEEEAAMMKKHGFYTLNYFNVAEMGTHIKFPAPPRTTENDNDLWKNANDFVYEKLGDAILMLPVNPDAAKGNQADYEGKPHLSWYASVVMDCGVPSYRDFLLEQARLHIEKVPSAVGICIDRLDWLRYYNLRGDDGVSWFHSRPSRSFVVAWNELLEPLGKILHDANKVIYANNMHKRMDVQKNLDGIYDEFGDYGTALNLTAFCTLKCPALGWTRSEKDLQPDPDAYFQRFIYLGVYPTAPLDGNDHTVRPDTLADKYFTDYGPLMDAIRGKQWVLQPRCIEVKGDAKANLFAVPGGFVVPVCFAKDGKTVEVLIRNVKGLENAKAEAIHPGGATAAVPVRYEKGTLSLQVPVERGTAMVRLTINNTNKKI